MLALLAATFFSSGFGLVLRSAMNHRCNPWAMGVINYIAATAFQLGRHAISGAPWHIEPVTLAMGSAVGCCTPSTWRSLCPFSAAGVSIPSAMSRLAVVMPMLAALLLWGERLTTIQSTGALLADRAAAADAVPAKGHRRTVTHRWKHSAAPARAAGQRPVDGLDQGL